MDIQVTQEERRVGVTVLTLSGALTDGEQLERSADNAIDAGARYILIDLSDVPYTATSGLRALHHIFDRLRTAAEPERGNNDLDAAMREGIAAGTYVSPHLKLLNPSQHTMHALQVAGYDMFLETFYDRSKALNAF